MSICLLILEKQKYNFCQIFYFLMNDNLIYFENSHNFLLYIFNRCSLLTLFHSNVNTLNYTLLQIIFNHRWTMIFACHCINVTKPVVASPLFRLIFTRQYLWCQSLQINQYRLHFYIKIAVKHVSFVKIVQEHPF